MTLSQFLANCKYPDYQNEFAIVRQPKEYLPNNVTIFQTRIKGQVPDSLDIKIEFNERIRDLSL